MALYDKSSESTHPLLSCGGLCTAVIARHVNERRGSQWDGCDVWLLKQYQHHPPWKVRFIFPWFARRKTFLQEMYGTLTPFCFPCTTWLICSLYLLVFWCGAIHSSLLTTALCSAAFNWVTRCFTSFLVEAENPSGSPTPWPPHPLWSQSEWKDATVSPLVCNRARSLSSHKGQIQSNLVERG